jgi:Ribbon-helix-helix protein, copG family
MHIDIPDDLNRRLEQLAKGTGRDVSALVCEAIEQRLALEEQLADNPDTAYGNGGPEKTDKPVWELFEDASREIPDEELDRLPTDGSLQHDHYIYGTPKRPV